MGLTINCINSESRENVPGIRARLLRSYARECYCRASQRPAPQASPHHSHSHTSLQAALYRPGEQSFRASSRRTTRPLLRSSPRAIPTASRRPSQSPTLKRQLQGESRLGVRSRRGSLRRAERRPLTGTKRERLACAELFGMDIGKTNAWPPRVSVQHTRLRSSELCFPKRGRIPCRARSAAVGSREAP